MLSNGKVYIGWASHGDQGPWHGWVIGYNATTLQQVAVYASARMAIGGGIWSSGGGLGADSSGNIYFNTGNGDFNVNTGGRDYGDSVVKLNPIGNRCRLLYPVRSGEHGSRRISISRRQVRSYCWINLGPSRTS